MSTYARRRLLAAVVLLLIAAGASVAFLTLTGGDSGAAPRRGPIGREARDAEGVAARPELAASRLRAVTQPTAIHGDGPVFEVRGSIVRRLAPPDGKGRVALTFDDGPGPYTSQVLEELRSLHVRATFFVIGHNVQQSPGIVRALRAAGMVVGNHSWSHPQMTKLKLAAQRSQVIRTQDMLEATIGQRPRFFRPPMWAWNRTTARAVAEQGMIGVLFSVDTRDWSRPGVTAIVRQALTAHDGQIIALHDAGGDREQTVRALPLIVKGLRARGLEPVTLDQLFRKAPS
ncbi:MAG TPA: polysaccharide deacetylase family protein [Gaiellales bacterium]|jgi:peptidoglycan/xylan/chitin deacetylase (PgdA/CDA1 family)|nr:polysaccharide deacetylase family protein [Gaiellales bacterium]